MYVCMYVYTQHVQSARTATTITIIMRRPRACVEGQRLHLRAGASKDCHHNQCICLRMQPARTAITITAFNMQPGRTATIINTLVGATARATA